MEENKSSHVVWHGTYIKKENREQLLKQKGVLLWFTGLSGAGKSTVANALEQRLWTMGKLTYLLDGDNIRHGLNGDLGFEEKDRQENIRRIKEVAKLFVDAGVITLATFISPYRADREKIQAELKEAYIEVYINCDLATCESRDPKGLYEKARAGLIKNFTGLDAPYEKPTNPQIEINTSEMDVEACVEKLLNDLKKRQIID